MEYKFVQGGAFNDSRGSVRFVNDFNMEAVKRFYLIKNANNEIIRGWRGHRYENRWFYVGSGSFLLYLVKIENWHEPDRTKEINRVMISATDNKVLHVPPGYGMAIKSLEYNSELITFADSIVENSDKDNFTWELGYFVNLREFEPKVQIHLNEKG
ncbi:WxcM-like domain-containing protein [Sphingobacterium humi]|uniref:Sugar 3,4-ketoisomerase QdtA cupin domain-containing protein n=1 Tax=Sphingobacterium humi TaxID=1796905 RepID=A0A6N8L7E3_9SPHI|nr:WxcM-like domain-containing protein [Sphingobacterium humi]MVZ63652.1 hypothetical protein [Sphingobacterium humi]